MIDPKEIQPVPSVKINPLPTPMPVDLKEQTTIITPGGDPTGGLISCSKTYTKNGLTGVWVRDNLKHDITPDVEDGISINRCTHCGGKMYPKNYA